MQSCGCRQVTEDRRLTNFSYHFRGCMIPGRSSLRLPSNGSVAATSKTGKPSENGDGELKMTKSKGSSVFDKLNVFHRDKSERAGGKSGSNTGKYTIFKIRSVFRLRMISTSLFDYFKCAGNASGKRTSSSCGFPGFLLNIFLWRSP